MNTQSTEIIVGRLPVLSCLLADRRDVERLYAYRDAKGLEPILARISSDKITWVDRRQLDQLADGIKHQGVALRCTPLPLLSLEDWLTRHTDSECALVALDSISDPRNFGAITRSAAACGAAGMLFPRDRSAPISTAAYKAAAGGTEYIDLVQVTNLSRALQTLKRHGFWVAALEAHGERTIWEADLRGRIVFLIGSEGDGIRRLVREQADFSLSIPLVGEPSSLNASVSAGIVLAEWMRQCRAVAQP